MLKNIKMSKTKVIILAISIIGLVISIGYFVYFVSGVSSTYPPIRKYEYRGSFNQLITGIRNYTLTNADVKFKIADTVGNKDNGYAIYLNIETKTNQDSIEYDLRCEEYNSKGNPNLTIISLVEVCNKTQNMGGYSTKAKGVDGLVNEFELNILKSLKDNQKIQISPL
jgi:hypothetical protein